ncbi:hypothetical protein KDL01_37735 [Actinospica durhamensis]|uniref:Uncharacterized protein n=1 Tax=Actinospica durhamensis TaxID=1508375 RepID=A0A941ISY2_9ACTN|nr:hypothetical protein [Actinospica durhamensis]MBR7839069.1 hypothetical protein [Actinospica durhamensis]
MNAYRRMAITVTTCAASLSLLAACAAGVTSANQGTSPSAAASGAGSSPTASPSHAASASAGAGSTVRVDAPIGSFPIPRGAQVVANMPCGKQILIELGSVTPPQASDFYNAALPSAGYQITDSTLSSDPSTGAPKGMAELMFTGHGFTGLIIAMANLGAEASADPSVAGLPGSIAKNAVEISLSPAGTTGTPSC